MDEAAAAAAREGVDENEPGMAERSSSDSRGTSTEDNAHGVQIFWCWKCGQAFREEAAYLEHRRQHSQENSRMHLDPQSDILQKYGERTNFCDLCSLSFADSSELYSHMEKHHSQAPQNDSAIQMNSGVTKQQTYECPECGKCYGVFGHFLNHQRSHRRASKSVFHELEHLKKKSFQCETCGRNYSRASALDAHRRCHEEKLIKRQNRTSTDSFDIEESAVEGEHRENQTDNTPEKLFKCSCGKAFPALLRLKTHQRFSRKSQCAPENAKEKPKSRSNEFYCSECDKSFGGHIALYNHQRWHANLSANRFTCEECGKVFTTLTFYYKHQRIAHSDETAAKSFLRQVRQLQKKAFQCKDCGLKFSRASALHSHQIHHTDVFTETEKEVQTSSSPPPQHRLLESTTEETELFEEAVNWQEVNVLDASMTEADMSESDEDMDSYEPGDFNVQVISASESEDESPQDQNSDQNSDLELLCESDQEGKDDVETEVSPSNLVSKPEMDLKIVQIDFEQAEDECALVGAEDEMAVERHDCPDCYRWFSSASSLRVHRMWHGVRKRRQQTPGQSVSVFTCNICGHETCSHATHCSHIQTHRDLDPHKNVVYQAEGVEDKNLQCNECGKIFSRKSALISHQLHHPKKKPFQCPDCMMSYSYASSLFNHMKNCSAQKKDNISINKKEFNPKKTLLGPKSYHCEQCGKGFWSLGAYSHHKQSQIQCADIRQRKGAVSLHSVNGHSRSSLKVACPVCGRKFRHRGIMTLHMRKHENGNHKCELCDRSFRLFSSLLRHQVVHNEHLLPPPVKSFQHQVDQLKKNTYSCPDCGKLFSRAKALQFHMKSHGYETGHMPSSPGSSVSLEDLQCTTCLAHFSNKASLRVHQKLCIKRDSQTLDSKAETSENSDLHGQMNFNTKADSEQAVLNTEIKNEIDTGEQRLENQISVCTLESQSINDLKYKCKECERSFSVIGALNLHKRIHVEGPKSEAKPKLAVCVTPKQEEQNKGLFPCSDCGRQFVSNSALGSHKRWHTEKKFMKDDHLKSVPHNSDGPSQCNRCSKQFFNQCVLQRHQMYNPQCQIKTEPEPDLNKTPEINRAMPQPEFPEYDKTVVRGSLLATHYDSEHYDTLESADLQAEKSQLISTDQAPEGPNITLSGSEATSSITKSKVHQCPLCSMTFAKDRGLRAHTWQIHSRGVKSQKKEPVSTEDAFASCLEAKTQDMPTMKSTAVMNKDIVEKKTTTAGRGKKKIKPELPHVKCSSEGALLNVNQESKKEIQSPEAMAEALLPPSGLSERTPKFLYKCGKCGKAFQTEEQLGAHKTKAKSRPYCCALCCHGCWTETQLQQHLVWHDEVRCRLPIELRYRLSAALASKPRQPNIPSDYREKSFQSSPPGRPVLNTDTQSQSNHKCQHCGKAFLSPTALQNHEAQHGNSDSYCCSICPRTFSEVQDLINHHQECMGDYKWHSDVPAAVSSGDTNGLTCHECGTTFCHETELHQHYIEHTHGAY